MKNYKIGISIFSAAVVIVILVLGIYFYTASVGATVSATGQSTLKVQPDQVSVTSNLKVRNESAQGAKDSLNKLSDAVTLSLESLGLNKSQIQTLNYNIYPDYSYVDGVQKLEGYIAQQSLEVVVSNFSLVPGIVDKAVDSGAIISGINFQLSSEKQSEYKAKALENASEDAKVKARATASGLGESLGSLISVKNQDFNYGPVVYYAQPETMGAAGTANVKKATLNLEPKPIEVSATVVVSYRIG